MSRRTTSGACRANISTPSAAEDAVRTVNCLSRKSWPRLRWVNGSSSMISKVGMVVPRPSGRRTPARGAEATRGARSAGAAGRARDLGPANNRFFNPIGRVGGWAAGRLGWGDFGPLPLSVDPHYATAFFLLMLKPNWAPNYAAEFVGIGNRVTTAICVPCSPLSPSSSWDVGSDQTSPALRGGEEVVRSRYIW